MAAEFVVKTMKWDEKGATDFACLQDNRNNCSFIMDV